MKRELRARSASAQESSPPSCPLTTPSSAPPAVNPDPVGAAELPREEVLQHCHRAARPSQRSDLFAETSPFLSQHEAESSLRMASSTKDLRLLPGRRLGQHFAAIRPTSPPRGSTASALSTSSPGSFAATSGRHRRQPEHPLFDQFERDPQARAFIAVFLRQDLNVCELSDDDIHESAKSSRLQGNRAVKIFPTNPLATSR